MSSKYQHVTQVTSKPTTADTTQESVEILQLDGVSKRFGDEQAVLGLDLTVYDGELLTLLGPSGCGKTTTLRLIAGLERPDRGTIQLDGETVDGNGQMVSPEDRDVGIVFQDFALFPHLTVAENVAFGIESWPREKRENRVEELLELVGLTEYADASPTSCSGGQQQRVALARSLAPKPSILLLDEPFSNLDVDLRTEMREDVRRILKASGVTGISVTHDQEEAMSISDRVAVMHRGRIEQIGAPASVFQRPQSRFVAGFLGHASFIPGFVSGPSIRTSLGMIDRDRIFGLAPEYDNMRIEVLVRPDDVEIRPVESEHADGVVTHRRYLGPTVLYRVELGDGTIVEAMHNHSEQVSLDESVSVELAATHELAWFPTTD